MSDLPNMKIKAIPSYPADILGGVGIEANKVNGHVIIDLAHGEFTTISSVPTSPTNTILTYDTTTRAYANIPSSLLGGATAGISDAPIDGTLYGRKSAAWVSAAPIASPAFTGNPTAPTPTAGDNDTSIATTAFVTAAVGGGSNFIQAGTGAVTRTMQDKARDIVHVKDFGAVCNGIADDTTAIQAALNTGKTVVLPSASTCKITGVLTITVNGTGLVGAGWQSSILSSTSTTGAMILVSANVNNIYLANFKLTRSVTAATNADGIVFAGNTEGTLVQDVWVEKQFNGYTFRTTAFGVMENVIAALNLNHGFSFTDTATVGVMQWEIRGALSSNNAGCGFLVATGQGTLQSTMGTWTSIYTFANSALGVGFIGTASAPIYDVRLMDMFLGSDGNSELFLDTYGGSHLIGNSFFELAGRGLTGPTNSTPATNSGSGIQVSANNRDVRINNCISDGHSTAGYNLAATQNNTLTGSRASNNLTYGLVLANGATGVMTGNQLVGNTSGPFNIVAFPTSVAGAGNSPPINPSITAALGADVLLNNINNYFDGPSITMGAGTWHVTASITVTDATAIAGILAKLWDGTTIIDSGVSTVPAAGWTTRMVLSGVYNSVVGAVVKISARDTSSTTGKLLFNNAGNAKDCTITAVRIG